jgi:hypothetical protein
VLQLRANSLRVLVGVAIGAKHRTDALPDQLLARAGVVVDAVRLIGKNEPKIA